MLVVSAVDQPLLTELNKILKNHSKAFKVLHLNLGSGNKASKVLNLVFFYLKLIKSLLYQYRKDKRIAFHYITDYFLILLPILSFLGFKVYLTYWGSDFKKKCINKFNKNILCASKISFTNSAYMEDFLNTNDYNNVFITRFGLSVLDDIDLLYEEKYQNIKNDFKNKYDIDEFRKVVVCGTNASENQQHMQIINQINNFAKKTLEHFHFIFLLNYGDEIYKKKIIKEIRKLNGNVKYSIFEKFLSGKDLAEFRIATDILLQLQKHDQLSCAMQETIYSGGLIITGSWLDYKILENNDISFFKIKKFNEIENMIHMNIGDEKIKKNKIGISKLSRWDYCSQMWLQFYDH